MLHGKIVERKQAKRKHGLPFFVIGAFTLAIEVMLGMNAAFLVDQSVGVVAHNMLAGTFLEMFAPLTSLIVSLVVGFCLMAGGMWTFAGFMDHLDDARAYRDQYGTSNWPINIIWSILMAVILLDFTTLMFRVAYFAEKGAVALFAFFVILIFLPPVLGPIIHVLEHTPHDRRLAKARMYAEALDGDDVERAIKEMDPDLRGRLLEGDGTALQEHYTRVTSMREENEDYERAAIAERRQKQSEKYRPLASASLASQAQLGSPKDIK